MRSPDSGTRVLVCLAVAATGRAQELEPRAYSPNPVDVSFLVVGSARSNGGILFDPSLPVDDVEARLNATVLGFGHTFSLFDRSASAGLAVPYVWGTASGNVGEGRRDLRRSGFADLKLRLAINVVGGPALNWQEFAKRVPGPTVGLSLVIEPPTGQYDAARLVNIGTNRWAFKPEIGVSYPVDHWSLEGYAGVWLFTDNTDYLSGMRRKQDPISSLQAHVSYTFRPQLWAAFDATYYSGGRTTVDDVGKGDRQANSRVGVTVSIPAGAHQSLKLSWSDGATTRVGTDFSVYALAWQYTWLK
ncbi:MAG TPA: transporter [Steroidobacteraceae bacterium]|jgi:hypothetical protein